MATAATNGWNSGRPAWNGLVDVLKFAGAVGILWFHLRLPYSDIALAALPMFVMLSVLYGGHKSIADRASRLLLPWLWWSVIYAVGKIAQILLGQASLAEELSPWMLLGGTAMHLWYLPFIFLATVVLHYVSSEFLLWASAILAFLLFNLLELPWPLAQWASVWPAVVVARTGCYWPGIALMALALLTPFANGAPQLLLAFLLVLLAQSVRLPSVSWTRKAAALSLGIYLVHPLVASIAGQLLGAADFWLVLAGSIALTMLLKAWLPRLV